MIEILEVILGTKPKWLITISTNRSNECNPIDTVICLETQNDKDMAPICPNLVNKDQIVISDQQNLYNMILKNQQ
jgi:hypothetical protein